jgi:type I restriction enzyme M protein
MPAFGKRTPLTHEHFAVFETCYGSQGNGASERIDQGEEGRFCCFTRQEIAKRGENLDISWLKGDDAHSGDDLPEPDEIAALIRDRLQTATEEMDALTALLEGEEVEV